MRGGNVRHPLILNANSVIAIFFFVPEAIFRPQSKLRFEREALRTSDGGFHDEDAQIEHTVGLDYCMGRLFEILSVQAEPSSHERCKRRPKSRLSRFAFSYHPEIKDWDLE